MRTSLVLGLAAALTAVLPAGPAGAAAATTDIVVLGDSYAAGNGAGSYYGPTNCWRSHATWAERYRSALGSSAKLTNVACNGATTAAVAQPNRRPDDDGCGRAPRSPDEYYDTLCRAWLRPQLDAVTAGTELVLLTLGGNDARFSEVVVQCFVPGTRDAAGCRGAVDHARAVVADPGPAGLTARLAGALAAVHARSPHAKVILLGYPQLIGTGFSYVLAGRPGYDAQAYVRDLHARGQAAQRAAVDRANAAGPAFATFAGSVADTFGGHEADPRLFHTNPQRWVFEALDGIASPEKAYHPNPLGHAAYAGIVASIVDDVPVPNRAPRIAALAPRPGAVVGTTTPGLWAGAADDDGDALRYRYRVVGPSVDVSSDWVTGGWTVPGHRLDAGVSYSWSVTVRDTAGATAVASAVVTVAMVPAVTDLVRTVSGAGYWQTDTYGNIRGYGDARFLGSLTGVNIRVSSIVGMSRTVTGAGYWLVGRDGGVFAFGDAPFLGSLPGRGVAVSTVVGMAPTPSGRGYWLVATDGAVYAFGDAGFHGSMAVRALNAPMAGIRATPSGRGYWLVARDGGVFTFGDAPFLGSLGGRPLASPVVDLDATPTGRGYWLAAEDGGVFTFGEAVYRGSLAGQRLPGRIVSLVASPDGGGYLLGGCDGTVTALGTAQFRGSAPPHPCRGTP